MTPLFYIHQTCCISPQQTFPEVDLEILHQQSESMLKVIEPKYEGIPPGTLRRMSKSVRIGMGAALPLLKQFPAPDGIIIGTANAGFEDCFHFLKQMVDYNEGLLTPGSFVQSTPNALAAQVGMFGSNKAYNITHVHLGLAFENAVIDAGMMIGEHPGNTYLLGAVDDISAYHYTLNSLAGWFKKAPANAGNLYQSNSAGSIAGEGAAMFLVNGNPAKAIGQLQTLSTLHSDDEALVSQRMQYFLATNLPADEEIDLFISGEDGDDRMLKFYISCEKRLGNGVPIATFKHMFGEYPTAAAMAVWLACYFLQGNPVPEHMIKKNTPREDLKNILIYNCHKGTQHSFILVKNPTPNQP